MEEKKVVSVKQVLENLWTGENPVIDPLIPAIIEAWSRVVPDSLRPVTSLEGIRDGILHILVSNPVAGQQLQFVKDSLGHKMNETLGRTVVKGFRIKSGAFPAKTSKSSATSQIHKPRVPGKSSRVEEP
jgi:hypothetical protein